ncbi:MAG: exodeoxyribonuclease V subunit alpha [Arsenophonus sp.]
MISLIKRAASEFNLFNSLDINLAILLVENDNPLLLLIFALLSAETRAGNVCLSIDKLQLIYLFEGKYSEIFFKLWEMAGSPDNKRIYTELKKCNAICDPQQLRLKPLVLSGNKLYFQRKWIDEGLIANFFSCHSLKIVDEERLKTILNSFFIPSKIRNWQKIAIAVAVTSQISIISGGPGTGKTTIIACLLTTLVKLSNKKLIIQLAAPTGKAAARLTESFNNSLLKLNLSEDEKKIIPEQAQTIHRLLGAQPDRKLLRYHKDNPLLLDVLIIDETSMIDLHMMARLIEALPKHARVIFLGDKDQLASIESGAILNDLCYYSKYGYSYERASQLNKITGYDLSDFISDNGKKIKDRICLLRKSYRFDEKSEIGQFAKSINKGNVRDTEKLLDKKRTDIIFRSINSSENYAKMLFDIARYYRYYLDIIKEGQNPEKIFVAFNKFRLLVSLREGPYGVIGLNDKLEKIFHRQGIIQFPSFTFNKNYEGRPIMITKNHPPLNLFNGDIGLILRDGQNGLKAFFYFANGTLKKIQPCRLPQHETAFVMTVHKSQGSEFDHVMLVLPPIFNSIITKEFIYTAITRAKYRLTIYANRHVFSKGLMTLTERCSGLTDRLHD